MCKLLYFPELRDVILSPFLNHFQSTFDPIQRMLFIHHLHLLLTNWCLYEYERCLNHVKRVFGTANAANDSCRTPLGAIEQLLALWMAQAEKGLHMAEEERKAAPERDNTVWNLYFNEVLTMCSKVNARKRQKARLFTRIV